MSTDEQCPGRPPGEAGIDTLRRILRPTIADNCRTRELQETVDARAEGILSSIRESDEPGNAVNQTLTFCYFSPLSRHHGSREILEYCGRGLGQWAEKKLADARLPDGLSHEHAWTICSMVPAYMWVEQDFDEGLNAKAIEAFAADASAYRKRGSSGRVGNQEMACYVADLLYAYVTSDEEYYRLARELGDAGMRKALDDTGQVVEQYGPCPHYSYLAYAFCFQYAHLVGTGEFDDRLRASLEWFRKWHTESLYLIPGASSRKYHVREMTRPSDLYSGMEYFAPEQPMYRKLLDRMMALQGGRAEGLEGQILVSRQGDLEPSAQQLEEWRRPFTRFYEAVHFGRCPIKYALISRKYQTGLTFTGWLPLMGLQTWAWGDEPPIVHPVHDVPSTTQAWGIDTARFPSSHMYYHNGPGCMAADIAWRAEGSSRENLPDEPSFVVWRNHTLRNVAIFTDVSTVLIQTGPTGRRVTRWTLNAIEPAKPVFEEDGTVRFEGRIGRVYALPGPPQLIEEKVEVHLRAWDPTVERNVQSLAYELPDGGRAAFAFSGDSFRFLEDNLEQDGILVFRDASGEYRADISTIVDERGDLTYGLDTARIKRTAD